MELSSLPPDHWTITGAYTPNLYRDIYPAIEPTSPALSQEGKVVMITGASRGIGARGFAIAFAKARPKAMILIARNEFNLQATGRIVQAISPTTDVVCFAASISDEAAMARIFALAAEAFGHIDVLINNAGVGSPEAIGPFADIDPARWWGEFGLNVKGTMLVTQGFLKLLGPDRHGTIVTMNTLLATAAMPGLSAYGSAKLATLRMMEYIAMEYPNVTAVSLQPGVVMTDAILDDFRRFALDTPELSGGTGLWLTTDAARFLSGRFISANWSVDDLVKQKDRILASKDLTMSYMGTFGLNQFAHMYTASPAMPASPVPAIAVTAAPMESPKEPSLRPKRIAKAAQKTPTEAAQKDEEQSTGDKSFFIDEDSKGGIKIKGTAF